MLMIVIFLTILLQILHAAIRNACVPNTQFLLNGKMCSCDKNGWWNGTNCFSIGLRNCMPGQIIWQGCSRCICQDNRKLICNKAICSDETEDETIVSPVLKNAEGASSWCRPFEYFYINCSICVCPPSGQTAGAHCVTDKFCQKPPLSSLDFLKSVNQNVCIPKVMYLFPCLHCLCSDEGTFNPDNCVKTCHQSQHTESMRRCISRTFYRKECNICWCPDNSISDDTLCTKSVCMKKSNFESLRGLRTTTNNCQPHSFIEPKCFYCTCAPDGYVNENACLEKECFKIKNFRYNVLKRTCSPGEMVPICVECFCLRNRTSIKTYCSSTCSYQSKRRILEKVVKDSYTNPNLIDAMRIKRVLNNETCEPSTIYLDQGRYCLCPENGNTNFKFCTFTTHDLIPHQYSKAVVSQRIQIRQNETCKPGTFVEIDCNTCYCSFTGKNELKWCTSDDCDAKKIILENHKLIRVTTVASNAIDTCIPGTISKADCNFCICPDSGNSTERVCTKTKCSEGNIIEREDEFTCESLAYYLVDCNVCLCPSDGIKNVEKCTKKICEKTFLRSDSCTPGHFFTNDCNVCVCPPNGNRTDKVCTSHQCADAENPWKRIFMLSQSVLDSSVSHTKVINKDLEVCFSGEQFEVGCKICVCPDVGLRSFAVCTESLCEDQKNRLETINESFELVEEGSFSSDLAHSRSRRNGENCITYNITDSTERKECTPGSMYIIRCQRCICPYVGSINIFCSPLPKNFYCEQAFPGYNYLPMRRRQEEANSTSANMTAIDTIANKTTTSVPQQTAAVPSVQFTLKIEHPHTLYNCTKPGKILDKCFICECEENLVVIEEHCFLSNAEACKDTFPSFLDRTNKVAIG